VTGLAVAVVFLAVVVLVSAWRLDREMRAVRRVLDAEQQRRLDALFGQLGGPDHPPVRHLHAVPPPG